MRGGGLIKRLQNCRRFVNFAFSLHTDDFHLEDIRQQL